MIARTLTVVLSTLLALGLGGPLYGQQQPKISVATNIVTVFATVREKNGLIVSNLTKDDFVLDEEGRPQTISYFARESDLPLTVGLVVDTSFSQRSALDQERRASSSFVDHTLREDKKDQAFLIHFDHEVELLQDFTSSRKKLESALDLLQTPQPQEEREGGRHRWGGGTLLYDAVFLASDDMMKKMQGRKAAIILSDGVDRGSKETLSNTIEAAQRANTIVYSILFKGERPSSPRGRFGDGPWGGHHGRGGRRYPQRQERRPNGKKVLDRISRETGGRLFEVSKKHPIEEIYGDIAEELRNQYVLGYTPAPDAGLGYHKIHVVVKQKEMIVQARDGYYADR